MKDYFYCCGIPEELSPYFCLEGISGTLAAQLVAEAPGYNLPEGVGEWEIAYPAFRVLPMGWAWSFHFAQVAHATVGAGVSLPAGRGAPLRSRAHPAAV